MNKSIYSFIGTCLDIENNDNQLTKIGDASFWDNLTEQCLKISREKFEILTGDEKISALSINFGIHPIHNFIYGEIPNQDGIGTVHYYYFLNIGKEASLKKILNF